MKIGIPVQVNKIVDKFFQDKRCIKFGKEKDGYCYMVYPKIKKGGLIISGGIGYGADFELELYEKFNAEILVFDPTPVAKKTMSKNKKSPLKYFPLGLSKHSGTIKLFFSKKDDYYYLGEGDEYKEFECKSVSEIANGRVVELLKMDIEGSEYGVIEDILEKNVKINQIILEFHHWIKGLSLLKTINAIRNLRKAGYVLVYKNIDDYTFVKKELLNSDKALKENEMEDRK